ncbi:MAG: CinA family nicotinamide mononucleotide deamidase-related protein [Anaerolineae bacterium]|nr:CinA family nicotinamide mononucleotide deamidase-related protein [Caldilineales bacterium]MDW8268814.1 CinA family nicotinamide mononucleotide deamidase-related protein [Anaerolineae bacterium]
MNVEIVTTGTELLLGEIVDTNAATIARRLREIGVNLYYKTTVGDNRARLAEVLRLGLQRSDAIIVTGGLGPTVDDITREAVADATGRPLELRTDLVERLQALFAGWGRPLTPNNLRQAYLPAGAIVMPNPIGTAVGFIVEHDVGGRTCAILCMPGVPREMERMLADHVLPYLRQRQGESGIIVTRTLHVAGVGESLIDDRIAPFMTGSNPTVGLAAHLGRVDVRIAARAPTPEAAAALIAPVEAAIRERLGRWIYGADDETLAGVVAGLLRRRRATIALLETNTAGHIAAMLRETAADLVVMALAGSDPAGLLGLETPLAAEEADACRAAHLLRERGNADYALVLLATQGPNQGFWAADRGHTWLALATPDGVRSERFGVGGSDEFSSRWLAVYGLNYLRLQLL